MTTRTCDFCGKDIPLGVIKHQLTFQPGFNGTSPVPGQIWDVCSRCLNQVEPMIDLVIAGIRAKYAPPPIVVEKVDEDYVKRHEYKTT